MKFIAQIIDKLIINLGYQGIDVIIPKIGDEFDAEYMQGLNMPTGEHTHIANIVSLGLRIDSQVIQPAMVMFEQEA